MRARFGCPACGKRFHADPGDDLVCPACGARLRRRPTQAPARPSGPNRTDSVTETAIAPPPAPQAWMLGRYRIEAPLDSGGQGKVYRARHINLDRAVAVKILDPTLSQSPAYTERFIREARLASQLSHRNVVRVLDAGQEGDSFFLVMELVEGTNLESLVAEQGPLPAHRAVRLVCDVGEGLVAAHAKGILHRDVKPGNVLLDPQENRVVLTDFGMAKAGAEEKKLTRTGTVLGTPVTMAPECCRGEPATEASDQYSLGATLFYLISGRYPYDGDNALAIFQMHINEPVPDLGEAAPGCPRRVADAVKRAMAKEPAARFPSIVEFVRAMRHERRRSPLDAILGSTRGRIAAAAVCVGLILAVGGAILASGGGVTEPARAPEDPGPVEEPDGTSTDNEELRGIFHATSVRRLEDGFVELQYEFRSADELTDFREVRMTRAVWDGKDSIEIDGLGLWITEARFWDVRIECEVEHQDRDWYFGLVYSIEEEHRCLKGSLVLYPHGAAEAEIESFSSGPPSRRVLCRIDTTVPSGRILLSFERAGGEWNFAVPGQEPLHALRELRDSASVGVTGSSQSSCRLHAMRVRGRLDPDWLRDRERRPGDGD
ncbi:MAG: protein kinase [Planctomycetes bacterium]|nr:protein kinase [Planctomycetota bacterium]